MTQTGDAHQPGDATIIRAVAVSQAYRVPRARLWGPRPWLTALNDIDLAIMPGEAVGIVGESGAGKSTLTRILIGDEKPATGRLLFNGSDLWSSGRTLRSEFRRSVQIVLQNPRSSLDPRMPVGVSLVQPLKALKVDVDHQARIREVVDQVGLSTTVLGRYPHEFSGGQLQRIAIARALMPMPKVLIADEPVSALDVSIQAQVLNLLKDLVADLGLALVLVAHDLSVVTYTTTRVAVICGGCLVEQGHPIDLFTNPSAPATKELVDAVLTVTKGLEGKGLR